MNTSTSTSTKATTSASTWTRWAAVSAATAARRVLADRSALAVSLLFYAVVTTVLGALWRAAAEANGGAVAGYDANALTWYVTASEAVVISLNVRLIEYIGNDIASGGIAVEMLRPASVVGVRLATELGVALPRLAACAAIGSVLAWIYVGPPPSWGALALAAPALVLAVTCNLAAQHVFAAAAFWVRDTKSAWFLYNKFVFVLGGMLIPLQVLPGWLHGAAMKLPFVAMAYVPARLVSGHAEPHLLALQAFWLAVVLLGARAAFLAGERRLQVVGG